MTGAALPVEVAMPDVRDVTLTREYPGYLAADAVIPVVGRVNGTIVKRDFTEGGRVNKFTNHDSGRFNMKTLVSMIDGRFTPTENVRGKIAAFERMHEIMQTVKVDEKQPVIITHADSHRTMLSFEIFLKSKGNMLNYIYSEIGSVIGSHMGPGTVGIAYIEKN